MTKTKLYNAPQIEVMNVELEQGIAQSGVSTYETGGSSIGGISGGNDWGTVN